MIGFLLGAAAIIYPIRSLPIVGSLALIRLIRRKKRPSTSRSDAEYHVLVEPAALTWDHLSCSLTSNKGGSLDKIILHDVSGEAKAGR